MLPIWELCPSGFGERCLWWCYQVVHPPRVHQIILTYSLTNVWNRSSNLDSNPRIVVCSILQSQLGWKLLCCVHIQCSDRCQFAPLCCILAHFLCILTFKFKVTSQLSHSHIVWSHILSTPCKFNMFPSLEGIGAFKKQSVVLWSPLLRRM